MYEFASEESYINAKLVLNAYIIIHDLEVAKIIKANNKLLIKFGRFYLGDF